VDIGSAVGRREGLSQEQVLALGDFEGSAAFTDLEKLVLRYAELMTRTPLEVPEDLFERLRAQLSPEQLVELTSAVAWENYRARFNHALDVQAEGYSEGAVCAIPGRGRGPAHG
jgi:alkylhydroperoxidase family enzyme